MSVSERHVQATANQSEGAKIADRPDGAKANAPTNHSPHADRPLELPDWQPVRTPWLVRNSWMVIIAVLLLAAAGLTYTYLYLQRTVSLGPFDRISPDAINRGASISAPEVPKVSGTIGSIASEPKTDYPQQSLSPINPVAAPPIAPTTPADQRTPIPNSAAGAPSPESVISAPTLGASSPRVTHTNPVTATQVNPTTAANHVAAARRRTTTATSTTTESRAVVPRVNLRQDQPSSGTCTDVVAALGLCKPQARTESK